MIKHIFKMIWNKKKQNSLLIVEILLSFMVIFGVFSYGLNAYSNYATPMGINYKQVWAISYNHTLDTKSADSVTMVYENLLNNIKAMPQVIDAGYHSNNIPFSTNHMSGGLKYKDEVIYYINGYDVDQNFLKVTGATMASGRWYNKADAAQRGKIVVINQFLKEKMFGKEDAIGKTFGNAEGKDPVKIIGVVNSIKQEGDYQKLSYGRYNLHDTAAYKWMGKILVKVAPGSGADFEGKLYKLMANTLRKSNIEIEHLDNKLTAYNKFTVVPLIIMSIVAGFLIINVALGIFGVLWYNINKRRGEIGLRRAVGATGNGVSQQLVYEALVLTTLSLVVGTFFAVQFPLLHVFDLPAIVYVKAMLSAIVFIYLLVLVCSLYPGKQAAAVYPAVALHEE
ncbi:ABC transporter permease [Mucilaginibacter myungsuensis]|uniref:ABC transporter permease n=1 Tax=Mucilaginibacter myungsuensis TaxID=649104 RepID=A0A929KY81_9SPHI|nr:FtsX-like permease family protein [Mucilaginibacter myungsuensis]MBE9660810.1 ABC transporter permease [Mucilaginibacter myungsuensis]MDN3600856.1 ABC transporter permease [Mucilaginibacter myungsuensis]